jgi:hypothetical protein
VEEVKDKVSYGAVELWGVAVRYCCSDFVVCWYFFLIIIDIACGALEQWCWKGLASAIVKMVVMKSKVFRAFLERERISKMADIYSSDRVTLTWLPSSTNP